jgi:hypothetical protein
MCYDSLSHTFSFISVHSQCVCSLYHPPLFLHRLCSSHLFSVTVTCNHSPGVKFWMASFLPVVFRFGLYVSVMPLIWFWFV